MIIFVQDVLHYIFIPSILQLMQSLSMGVTNGAKGCDISF